ncbi:TetR/AcrR family transcriptional regulator [Nocardioides oleivorans]|uniref:TetR/AcrR family transcriptional regulator n=1 Tax=Nocardioides oleivorans TaxID=273676 RepID=A0A4Q2RS75_9ACTN|nr:TetR/AcrR family transcriptional regulator [Nocardioides oleivorans]RYB91881.1 TetR/AcrR family transcriptional regulator [Nocardioides oleivorans]
MRADARRNRDLIVESAREVFREQGYNASLDLVAKRAGVGAGTLYRHFPSREDLVNAVMQVWVDRVEEATEKVLAFEGPPRELLDQWLMTYAELISLHKGGPAKITAAMVQPDSPIAPKCKVLRDATSRVTDRLHEEGVLREGITAEDVCRLVGGVATVADGAEQPVSEIEPLLKVLAAGMAR